METNITTKVNELLVKEDAINVAIARNFNIYKILGIESKETYICRAIAALLDDNYHNQGDCFLKLFFKFVLGKEYKESEYKIITEYSVKNLRRIDIVIESKDEFIPIEVKIYAKDQKSQCYDYCNCKENKKEKIVYYLTLDGHLPSEDSIKNSHDECLTPILDKNDEKTIIGYEGVECITFEKHILSWLSECLKCDCAIRIDNIRVMILQLQENIRVLTSSGDKINSNIQKLFNSSNISNVQTIYKKYNELKKTVIEKIFELIMNYYGIEKTKENGDIDIRKAGERYPYIRFKIRNEKEKENNINIWFSIEINEETGRLWVGINCSKGLSWFDAIKEGYYEKFIKTEINSDEWFTSDWWLLNKTVEGSPDFYNLVEFTKWLNNEKEDNKKDNDKGNIEILLENIDKIKNQLTNLFKSDKFPQKSENINFNNIIESLYKSSKLSKADVKIAEAFEEYKIIFQKEWINFLANKIEDETNSKRINVKNNKGFLLSEYLYFNLYNGKYDGKDYHILYAIENIYCGLVVTDENYNQMIDSSKIKQGKAFPLLKNIEEKLFDKKNMYKKEIDKYLDDWWLYWQNNKILDSNTDFENKYLYKNSNNNRNKKDKIEIIINDIKSFRDKLNNNV